MHNIQDYRVMMDSRGSELPHGYILPNGVIVVYRNGCNSNNVATIEQERKMFPMLVLEGKEK